MFRDPRVQEITDVIPGEAQFLVWNPRDQTIEAAQFMADSIRRRGATVVGCTLDEQVTRGNKCPVCGAAGLK